MKKPGNLFWKSGPGIIFLLFILCFSFCKKPEKQIKKTYVYGVDKVALRPAGTDKPNVKTTTEFISITYSDLFGTAISNSTLVKLSNAYSSFGDKKLVEDLIIKNFLNSSSVSIPGASEMRNDISLFVGECYKKFYNRLPSEYEKWFLTDKITKNSSIDPKLVYYAFLTSNEYRYY